MAHTYNVETGAWIQDPKEGWVSSKVVSKNVDGDQATLVFEITAGEREGEKLTKTTSLSVLEGNEEDNDLPPLMNPPILEASDDLTSLSHLNEPAVLQAIKLRYAKREIYTYSGIVLIATNPFERMDYLYDPGLIQAYAGKRREDQDPHLFAIADTAYQAMVRDEKNQTIVVSGESGAGKTVSAKYIMRYFATVEDPNRPGKRKKSNQGETMSKTEEQILATNPIMEAFGNAKTTRNDNSSRFGKYIEIMFDKNVDIVGAKIRTYLLERSRLVYQPATERNYHIFYQLIAGCSEDERKQLGLLPVEEFEYMNQGGEPVIPHMDDAAEFKLTRDALGTIGVPELTQTRIWKVLAALLHLGNTKIEAVRTGSVLSGSEPSLAKACELLGVDAEEFAKWTTKKQLVMRNEKTISPLNQKQAIVVRDSIAKFIYSSLFDWLVETINNSLAPEEVRDKINSFIGVLDIYGFEHFKRNSFEQFCINYANEKLQQEFNQHVFKLEQEEYAREQINWAYIEFSDNRPCIDLIEGKMGILSLLDEESRLPAGSDDSFVNKLHSNYGAGKPKDFPYQKPRFGKTSFTVCHYAVDVTYDSEGFIEKNRDTVPDEHMELLKASTNPFLTEVLQAALSVRDKETPTPSKTAVPAPGPVRRAGAVGNRKPTLGGIFKSSLIDLMTTIGGTNVHYIRCIKPNEAKVAWKFEGPMVLSQLQACGVLETVKISCAGYPTRWTYEEFAARYYMLIPSDSWNAGSIRDVGLSILKKTIPEEGHPKDGQKDGKDKFQLGMSKIFFRAGMLAYLENMRTTRLNQCAVLIQKNMKKKYYRKRYLQARESILNCQAYTRGFLARRKVQEMLVVRAVVTIQRFWRGSRERKAFNKIRESVVKLQAVAKGFLCRKSISDRIVGNAARYIQRAWKSRKFLKAWRTYRKRTIYIQSVWRGKIARREYKKMREEARDLKQISYKLENKVVELTQAVGKLKQDNKALLEKVESFDNQVKTWRTKHANLENRNKELQMEANQAGIASARLSQMDEEMRSLQRQFEESTANMKRLQEEGKSLRESLNKRTSELDDFKNRDKEHENEKQTLRAQIQALEEQLEHAGPIPLEENGVIEKPAGGITNGIINFVSNKKPKRRSAEASRLEGEGIYRSSYTARPASMMPTSAPVRLRDLDVQFSPKFETAEYELHRILEEDDQLSDEVSNGLITNLKIPSINGQTPLHEKEVLYPAYLINVVTSEMWNNGFVKESERFLANVMHTIQQEVMSHEGDEAINQGVFWLSNVHEMLSFVFLAEDWYEIQKKDDYEYDRLLEIVKHDLESLEFNIYHTWMKTLKRRLQKMIVPAIIESQSLPGFVTNDGNRFLNKILQTTSTPQFSMDDLLSLLNKIYKAMKAYYIEESIIAQAVTELLKLVGVTAFNDLLMRRNFLSWKRGLQINYNITRIEEWCKSHDMPEGTLQLEHLMQATKLLQLKKATLSDIEIIQDICWMLSPNQIQKLLNQYLVADYEQPINGEIMKAVASRVTEKSDVLLLAAVDMDDSGPYEIAEPRQINALETYCPSYLTTPRLRRLADIVSAQAQARAEDERKKTEEKLVEKRPELEAVHE